MGTPVPAPMQTASPSLLRRPIESSMSPFSKASSIFKRFSAHVSPSPSPQKSPPVSPPTKFGRLDGMGSPNGTRPTTAGSAFSAPGTDTQSDQGFDEGGAVGEPIVYDFQAIHDELPAKVREPRTPHAKPRILNPLGSNPVHSSDDEAAPPPPDFTHRGIHIPTRTSSKAKPKYRRSASNPLRSMSATPESRRKSSADSVLSLETTASSTTSKSLSPSQSKGPTESVKRLSPLLEDDPQSFDLVGPEDAEPPTVYSLEHRSEQLFSKEHLEAIFRDSKSLLRFTSFLSSYRHQSVPVLIYYLDALKAQRAINYANAIAEALEPLEGYDFTLTPARTTVNAILEDKAKQAFDVLVRDDLPAFITHVFVQAVSVSIHKRISGALPPLLRDASEGLAEVFCLTDPSRVDNPIIFASEEFHRTTQYGVNYAIGRNCRFLQGPRTNPFSISRLQEAVREGKETSELVLNYRRDGSPFMNLLMMAPLLDAKGKLRYYIGAQVDVSELVKDCTDLEAFRHMLDKEEGRDTTEDAKDEFQELCEMFNVAELDTVRKHGGGMHREHLEGANGDTQHHKPRLLLKDPSKKELDAEPIRFSRNPETKLSGVYKHYLLVRPHPSLRILFTSPSLRVPGILQSRFLDRVGGSTRVRDSLAEALADGTRGVTAKIRWLSSPTPLLDADRAEEGRKRWIHCTPLLGSTGAVGVWMVILVDDDSDSGLTVRRFRHAPPVAKEIRRASYSSSTLLNSIEDSEGEGYGTGEEGASWRTHAIKNKAVEAIRRPQSSMSDLRSRNQTRSPSLAPSVNSFALL